MNNESKRDANFVFRKKEVDDMKHSYTVNERTRILLEEIDNEIKRLQDTMRYIAPDDESYKLITERLKILIDIKKELNEIEFNETTKNRIKVDPNIIFSGATTLLLTLVILKYEKFGNITSKAFGFIPKLLGRV